MIVVYGEAQYRTFFLYCSDIMTRFPTLGSFAKNDSYGALDNLCLKVCQLNFRIPCIMYTSFLIYCTVKLLSLNERKMSVSVT